MTPGTDPESPRRAARSDTAGDPTGDATPIPPETDRHGTANPCPRRHARVVAVLADTVLAPGVSPPSAALL